MISCEIQQDDRLKEQSEWLIREVTGRLVNSLAHRPEAVVLTGSFARGEGSVLRERSCLRVLGDMEFMVFFASGTDLAERQLALNRRAQALREELAAEHVDCEVEFSAVSTNYLRRLRPHIFGYELLNYGRTVWGSEEILKAAPVFSPLAIPLWDAWRMLNNRLLEQLHWPESLERGDREALHKLFYQLMKLYLDIGTTLLVFAGHYQGTYAGRANALRGWAAGIRNQAEMQFVQTLAQRVGDCTRYKLSPDAALCPLGVRVVGDTEELRANLRRASLEVLPLARAAWRWETARLADCRLDPEMQDAALLDAVLRAQSWKEKFRGWAKLALMPAVRGQSGFVRRMFRLLHRGSPRYLIYCVASNLYFQLPELIAGAQFRSENLENLLPVVFSKHQHESNPWRNLRADVLSGWQLFLRNHWA